MGRTVGLFFGSRSKVHIFRSASIIWGAVGPERFFSGEYRKLYWGFALGVVIPLIPWLLHKRLERIKNKVLRESIFSKTVVPIILHGAIAPPATPTNVCLSAHTDHYWRLCLCVFVAEMGTRAVSRLVRQVQVRCAANSAMFFQPLWMPVPLSMRSSSLFCPSPCSSGGACRTSLRGTTPSIAKPPDVD